jgi:sugar lactone lactonase YvrE
MVFGQPYMSWNECNSLGLSAGSLCNPGGLVVASDVLYVADRGNHRVVAYEHPLTTDSEADHVFGQMDGMGTGTCNLGGVSQNSLCTPIGLAVDGAGNLFVADFNNHRVLEYDMPLTTDTEADMVFGQPDFMTATCNTGGVSANSLCNPRGPAVDQAGSLYVADGFVTSPRVLVFENPLVNTEADVVFGQPDFMTTGCNTGGISARSVCTPSATTFDAAGNLYLADQGNNRILIYFNPQTDVDPLEADLVIGQPDFSSGALYAASASSLNQALDLALDSLGNLYVSDTLNNRVLVYRTPPITDGVADLVYGQLDFTHASPNFNGTSAVSMRGPRGVALDADDNLYVSDLGNSRVLVYDTDADFDGLFGSRDGCPRQAPTRGIDTDHDGCTDTIAVLKTIVQGMTIEASLKNGLLGKLDEAQKALDRGSTQVAINKLQNFVDQVEGQRGKKINNSDADLLEAYAGNLITLFGP